MTGFYVRMQRDGKWDNIEIDQLTDEEFATFARAQGAEKGWLWAKALAGWIRDNVEATEAIGSAARTKDQGPRTSQVITIREGAYCPMARLECDSCGAELPSAIAIMGKGGASAVQREHLRDMAQQAGWTYIVVPVRSTTPRDLCPKCFTMPPEG